jgi:hypothetical protein
MSESGIQRVLQLRQKGSRKWSTARHIEVEIYPGCDEDGATDTFMVVYTIYPKRAGVFLVREKTGNSSVQLGRLLVARKRSNDQKTPTNSGKTQDCLSSIAGAGNGVNTEICYPYP